MEAPGPAAPPPGKRGFRGSVRSLDLARAADEYTSIHAHPELVVQPAPTPGVCKDRTSKFSREKRSDSLQGPLGRKRGDPKGLGEKRGFPEVRKERESPLRLEIIDLRVRDGERVTLWGPERRWSLTGVPPEVLDKEGVLSGVRVGEGVPGASHLRRVGEAGAGVGQVLGEPGEPGAGRGGGPGCVPGAERAEGADAGEQQQRGAQGPGQRAAGAAGGRGRPLGLGVRGGVGAGAHGRRLAAAARPGAPRFIELRKPRFPGRGGWGCRRPAFRLKFP